MFDPLHLTLQVGTAFNKKGDDIADVNDEDHLLLQISGRCHSLGMCFDSPEYKAWLDSKNGEAMTLAYNMHRLMTRHVQEQGPDKRKRCVLSSPFHLLSLNSLFQSYPNAVVVLVKSDAAENIQNWCRSVHAIRRKLLETTEQQPCEEAIINYVEEMIDRSEAFRQNSPNLRSQIIEVNAERILKDSVKTIKQLYQALKIQFPINSSKDILTIANFAKRHRKGHLSGVLDGAANETDALSCGVNCFFPQSQWRQMRNSLFGIERFG